MTRPAAPPASPPPSAAELLDAWEQASAQPAWARPLTLLAVAGVERAGSVDELARLPVGARDERLLALREAVFGPALAATAACPACGEIAEFDLPATQLVDAAPASGSASVEVDGEEITFRLPTTADLAAVADAAPDDPDRAVGLLLERCAGALDPAQADAVIEAMEAADPVAAGAVDVVCPACGQQWSAPLDVAAFVWQEVEAWGERTLGEVDGLARAYGWREPEVLALSPWRRRRYLELAWT